MLTFLKIYQKQKRFLLKFWHDILIPYLVSYNYSLYYAWQAVARFDIFICTAG